MAALAASRGPGGHPRDDAALRCRYSIPGHFRLTAPRLPEKVAEIAERMTDLTVEMLGKRREVTAVAVQCIAPGH
ncbi:MAG: tautomerase family protein [Betaproteobacteria bacterium]|nr:tautomerase family protein [Betaproteobacteria bacterium]